MQVALQEFLESQNLFKMKRSCIKNKIIKRSTSKIWISVIHKYLKTYRMGEQYTP